MRHDTRDIEHLPVQLRRIHDITRESMLRADALRLLDLRLDRKYGAGHSPIARLALHARSLRFVHPITRKIMDFETPIPARFAALV